MEPITKCQVELFADQLPSMDQLKQLSEFVHSSESELIKFGELVQENISKTGGKAVLTTGIGLFILGRYAEAAGKLQKAVDCKEKFMYLAFAHRRAGRFEQAIDNLQKSLDYGADSLQVTLEKTSTYRQGSNPDASEKELKSCVNFANVSAEYHYQLGRLQEAQGLYEEAMDNYKMAIELAPNHQRALFHLAYRCDLSGDEDEAIDYYKQILSISPVYVSALMNLAVLYEDSEEYDKASMCVSKVLAAHPNHQKAIMFSKDIESSKTMVYDEEKEKKKDHKNKILEMPISDFELSVRSRNCLKRMKIETIGDLLHITEAELLSYKNFGETSLREIKSILDPRALHLGMALDGKQVSEEIEEMVLDDENAGLLSKSIEEMPLSIRAQKCLRKLNIHTLADLTARTDAELLACKNFGVTSLNEIKNAIDNLGLSLRQME